MSRLISVNVGLPRDVAWQGKVVFTGVWKYPLPGRALVRKLNVAGDGQGDVAGHGGEYRAVMVYQVDSYRYWEQYLGRKDFTLGQFGENFTVDGLADDEVCIGDRYQIGSALFEVTQPRVTCYRLGLRMDRPDMAALVVAQHRPGFYFRVLQEGEVGAGDEIVKVSDGPERITVADIDGILYLPGHARERLNRALKVPALSAGWVESLRALAADKQGSGNAGLTRSLSPKPAWKGFRPLRVDRIDRESETVQSFTLGAPDGEGLPPALPGQFLVIKLQTAAGANALLRNYSLSGEPGADSYRISVKREPNGVASQFLHTSVKTGDMLQASAPRGTFSLQAGEGPVVLISAGVGITPLLAMLYSLAASRATRPIWWIHGTRNGNEHPFAAESRTLLSDLSQVHSFVVYSRPTPTDRLGVDYGKAGRVDLSTIVGLNIPKDADFYLCGPTLFLKDLRASLTDWGVAKEQLHSESFGPGEALSPGILNSVQRAVHAPADEPASGQQVAFTRSGLTVHWNAKYQSLLELAEACDVPVRWSCRTGVCHMCETGLVGGTVQYEPCPLDSPADGNLLLCCSKPNGNVELDL